MILALTILVLLFVFIFAGVYVPFAIGFCAFAYIFILHGPEMLIVMPQVMFSSVNVFSFLAVPGFILAGEIMSEAKITDILVNFVRKIVGRIPGGLAHVNILNSVFFAGLSGSALADAAGVGPIEVALMVKGGYRKNYSAALTAASAVIGPIIPPSVVMVIYALIAGNVSIGALFMAGYLPGLLIAAGLMLKVSYDAIKNKFPRDEKSSFKEIITALYQGIIPLLMPIILIGGILSGVFTATEASAVAVLYGLIIGIFVLRTIKIKDLPAILYRSAKTAGVACIMVTMAKVFAYFLAEQQVLNQITVALTQVISNKNVFLVVLLIYYLLIGCILDNTSAMVLSVPILLPVAMRLGIHPLHFGMITNVAMCLGLITPPVGQVLFVVCKVVNVSFEDLVKEVMPFVVIETICLILIAFIPQISLWLPKVFGFI